jgi:hypothetical protein
MASIGAGISTGTSIPQDDYLAAGITLAFASTCFVVARVTSNFHQKSNGADDGENLDTTLIAMV